MWWTIGAGEAAGLCGLDGQTTASLDELIRDIRNLVPATDAEVLNVTPEAHGAALRQKFPNMFNRTFS